MLKAIFLDMDNTLLETEELYDSAKFRLFEFLGNFGVRREEANATFDAIDRELYKTYGYSRARQPAIFEGVLKTYIPDADEDLCETVRAMAETIFEREARIKEGAIEAVALFASKYPVYIVTAGDIGVQESRVAKLPFLDQLAGIFIVETKNRAVYEEVLAKTGFAAHETLMTGDSLKSDVLPAADAGMQAVWIEAHNFQMEKVSLDKLPEGACKFESLLGLARHVTANGTALPASKPTTPKNQKPKI